MRIQVERSKVKVSPAIWMKVTPVIRSFCRVGAAAPLSFVWIISYVAYIQHMRRRCVTHHFQDERSKARVKWAVQSLYRVRTVATSLFQRFTSYEIHTQPTESQCVSHHFQDKRFRVKVTWVASNFGPVRSMASFLFDWITSHVG